MVEIILAALLGLATTSSAMIGVALGLYVPLSKRLLGCSLSEAVQTLLSGNVLSWPKFGDHKAGTVALASPGARRLFHYLLSCDRTKVAEAKEELIDGLIAAWQKTSSDPATIAKAAAAPTNAGSWRLVRLESSGFGGLNLIGGPNFALAVNGENWCLEGQNGSGKTSLASAIMWGLTGYRYRDQVGVVMDDGLRLKVFNDSGVEIGTWPPLVAYPSTPGKLSGNSRGLGPSHLSKRTW